MQVASETSRKGLDGSLWNWSISELVVRYHVLTDANQKDMPLALDQKVPMPKE